MSPQNKMMGFIILACLSLLTKGSQFSGGKDSLNSGRRSLLAESIPSECFAVTRACSSEIQSGSDFFGSGEKLSASEIDKFIKNNRPSSQCCAASKLFTEKKCNCIQAVVNIGKSYTGGDESYYRRVASGTASACGFPNTC